MSDQTVNLEVDIDALIATANEVEALKQQTAALTNLQQFSSGYEYAAGAEEVDPPKSYSVALKMLREAVLKLGKVIATTADPIRRRALAEAALQIDAAEETLKAYMPDDGV